MTTSMMSWKVFDDSKSGVTTAPAPSSSRQTTDASTAKDIQCIADIDDAKSEDDQRYKRGHWRRNTEYILSCLGLTVGLGNVWRFPYICYKNGGGSFLIPYTVMLFFVGMPLFFLEASIGQYSAKSPVTLFKTISPLFSGVGYAMVATSFMVSIVYSMVIGWSCFYFFDSFRSDVRWKSCDHHFNTDSCFNINEYEACKNVPGQAYLKHNCYNSTFTAKFNLADTPLEDRMSPAQEYFDLFVLNKSSGIDNINNIEWKLLVCLVFTWALLFICCIKGIKSSGKIVYFTVAFPYFALFILLVRGLTLPGAYDGVSHFLTPNWKKMITVNVWQEAAIQIFFTTSIASGGVITLSSYNKFRNNFVRDTLIVTILNSLTSLIAGLAVFSVIGYMAKMMGVPIEEVAVKGPGIAFVTFANAIARMPAAPAWAILFFLMIVTLGLDSMFGLLENVISSICDENPHLRSRKWMISFALCLIGFVLAIPMATGAGVYIIELVLSYLVRPMLFIGILECFVVAYIYGIEEFMEDVKEMVSWNPNIWVKTHIQVVLLTVTPFILMMVLFIIVIDPMPLMYGSLAFQPRAHAIGWLLSLAPIMLFFVITLYKSIFTHRNLSIEKKMKVLTTSTPMWRLNAMKSKHDQFMDKIPEDQFS